MLGTLFVIAAPSGTGKTSLVNTLVNDISHIVVSISHTTRPKRPGEEEGVHYYFVKPEQFETMVSDRTFLEYATVFGCHYGTSRAWVEKQLQAGKDVILEIDWQGAKQIKQQFPQAVGVFIFPPSRGALASRLEQRQQDNPDVIAKRLVQADAELTHYKEFDYLVVNDDFDRALKEIEAIVMAERLRLKRQMEQLKPLLADLLKNE